MSTDRYDRMQQGTSSNCCGAIITMQGLCSDCGEHCTDDNEEGPDDLHETVIRMQESQRIQDERYR